MEPKTKKLLIWGLILLFGIPILSGILSGILLGALGLRGFFMIFSLLNILVSLCSITGLVMVVIAIIKMIQERNTPNKIIRIAKRAK